MRLLVLASLLSVAAAGGPVEFGLAEVQAALAFRGMKPTQLRLRYDLGPGLPGSWRIEGPRVSGGDLQGLMYGLLEAAAQVRARGRLAQASGTAALAIRGVRLDVAESESVPDEEWRGFLELLAHSRINRLQLILADSEPPVEFLQRLSRLCAEFAIDLVVGLRAIEDGFSLYSQLRTVLAELPLVRSIHIRLASEPDESFYRQWMFRAVEEAGRRVTLEFDHRPPPNSVPTRVAQAYGDVPSVFSEATTGTYFEVPSPLSQGVAVWCDPAWTRHVAGILQRTPALGFEVEAPWPWQPHKLFFLAWGRAGYNPKISDRDLAHEAERLYGKQAGANAYPALTSASHAFSLAVLFRPATWLATAEETAELQKLLSQEAQVAAEHAAKIVDPGSASAPAMLALINIARQQAGDAMEVANRNAKPQFLHFPPKAAPAGIRFPLGLIVKPVKNERQVRLHYRSVADVSFHTISAAASAAWFQLEANSDLIYYFEIVTRENQRWFHPDPLSGSPYLYLPVRPRVARPALSPDA
jgi:hypothetical protein